MRVLAIETSCVRGTLALVSDSEVVAVREHSVPNAHGEQLLGMLESALADAGWGRSSIDRVAVGLGPGSFTGLRVGIAFAQGVAIGLGRPLVGVGSLRAMASAAKAGPDEAACAVLDARRGEVFVAAFDAAGAELVRPTALAPSAATNAIVSLGRPAVIVGAAASLVAGAGTIQTGPERDLPHAACTGRLAAKGASTEDPSPIYVRPADAIRPNLPPSPLSSC